MKPFKHKIISILLLIILILPVFTVTLIPTLLTEKVSAKEPGQTSWINNISSMLNKDNSWIKGILMLVLSFLINNVITKDNTDKPDHIISDKPAVDDNTQNEKEALGFYVNWVTESASSYEALKNNWRNIDMVAPFWYTLNPDGNIESRYGGHQYEVDSLSSHRNIKVLPLINNNQQNNMILVNPDIRKKAVNNVVKLIEKHNYDGVNIDFEFLPSWTRQGYTAFIKSLSQKLQKNDKILTISVFPKIDVPLNLQGAYDYSALAPYVDRVILMTYDNHWSTGPAGPIAPINWVKENIKYALEYFPPQKIIMGIANYGYDWTATGLGKDLGTKEAAELARNKNVEIKWDQESQSPYFNYQDQNGKNHEVWFENSYSLKYQLKIVNEYDLRGIAIWRLGNGDASFWKVIDDNLKS